MKELFEKKLEVFALTREGAVLSENMTETLRGMNLREQADNMKTELIMMYNHLLLEGAK